MKLSVLYGILTLIVFMGFSEGNAWGKQRYSIHAASYKNFESAQELMNSFKKQGYESFYEVVSIPQKGEFFRILVGRYETKKEALGVAGILQREGKIENFIILRTSAEASYSGGDITASPRITEKKSEPEPSGKSDLRKPVEILEKAGKKQKNSLDKIAIQLPENPVGKEKEIKKEISGNTTLEPLPEKPLEEKFKQEVAAEDLPTALKPLPRKDKRPFPYQDILSEFESGNYDKALNGFQSLSQKQSLDPLDLEFTLRRIGDCYYHLGKKNGNNRLLFQAVDSYRNLLRAYPRSDEENAEALFRIALSYDHLQLDYEALRELNDLYTRYPESAYIPETLFMTGKMYCRTGNYIDALKNFEEYVRRFPQHQHVKDASFFIADCYVHLQRFDEADVWYEKALKRWPKLEDIPQDVLMNTSYYFLYKEAYEEALRASFVYVSLFPESKQCKNVLYTIGQAFMATNRLPQALKVFGLLIERYPVCDEAAEVALLMAENGLKSPGSNVPGRIFSGMRYYDIDNYEETVGDISAVTARERLLFLKGCALLQKSRYGEALRIFRLLLKKYPYGVCRDESYEKLIESIRYLTQEEYEREHYIAVSELFFDSLGKGIEERGDCGTLFRMAESLKKLGLADNALALLRKISSKFQNDPVKAAEIALKMATIAHREGLYEECGRVLKPYMNKTPKIDGTALKQMHLLNGDACYRERLFEKAAEHYSRALTNEGDNKSRARIYLKYAGCLKAMNKFAPALVQYKRALDLHESRRNEKTDDFAAKCCEGLGECLSEEGRYVEAAAMYQKALEKLSDEKQTLWVLLKLYEAYRQAGNSSMADTALTALKEKGNGGFWDGVVKYAMGADSFKAADFLAR